MANELYYSHYGTEDPISFFSPVWKWGDSVVFPMNEDSSLKLRNKFLDSKRFCGKVGLYIMSSDFYSVQLCHLVTDNVFWDNVSDIWYASPEKFGMLRDKANKQHYFQCFGRTLESTELVYYEVPPLFQLLETVAFKRQK